MNITYMIVYSDSLISLKWINNFVKLEKNEQIFCVYTIQVGPLTTNVR